MSQLYEFYATSNSNSNVQQTFNSKSTETANTKEKQTKEIIETKLLSSTVSEIPVTTSPPKPTEESEQPNKPISNSALYWWNVDLPYPPPAKHRTNQSTITTHLPIPDDELVATFRAKYKEFHDNMFTGKKR